MRNEDRGYTITRTFDAPREAVWEAWTRAEHFAVWFGTDALPMEDVVLDVRTGGRWRGRMLLPDGSTKDWHGIYREVVEPERLVVDLSDEPPDEFDTFTVTLEEAGPGRTRMTLRQSGGHLSDEEYEQAKAGTSAFIDTMEDLVQRTIKSRHET
jgi:uncharacterized protein YndB with AHSA1/START domain